MPVNGKPNGRFELPQLTPLNFSLTDGTDIPPPPASPIEEKPAPELVSVPVAPKHEVSDDPVDTAATNGTTITNGTHSTNGINGTSTSGANGTANGIFDGRGRTNVAVYTSVTADNKAPMSPISATKPSSIRRFLSRKSLNTYYENDAVHEDLKGIDRPESAMSFASGVKKTKPSWFRRFSSNHGGGKTAVIYEEKGASITPMGPPPPKLPELSKLRAKISEDDEGSLGGEDLFKNIK